MKKLLVVYIAAVILQSVGFCDDIITKKPASEIEGFDIATQVIALVEARKARYQFSLLEGEKKSDGSDINVFEKYFPSLSDEEKLKLIVYILSQYNYDGEYSFRFRQMIKGSEREISSRLSKINQDRLKSFVLSYYGNLDEFADCCDRYFGVKVNFK